MNRFNEDAQNAQEAEENKIYKNYTVTASIILWNFCFYFIILRFETDDTRLKISLQKNSSIHADVIL